MGTRRDVNLQELMNVKNKDARMHVRGDNYWGGYFE